MIQHKSWDSDILGIKMGDLQYPIDSNFIFDKEDYDHISIKVPSYDIAAIQKLEQNGFIIVDICARFSRKMDTRFVAYTEPAVRLAAIDDFPMIDSIITDSFTMDKYHSDPYLPKEFVANVYLQWAYNAYTKEYGDAIFVAESPDSILGFTCCRIDKYGVGHLDLTATTFNYKIPDVGDALLIASLMFLKEQDVEVVSGITQIYNTASLSLHSRHGFKTTGYYTTMVWGKELSKCAS